MTGQEEDVAIVVDEVVAKLSSVPESSPTPTIASSSESSSTGVPGQGEGVGVRTTGELDAASSLHAKLLLSPKSSLPSPPPPPPTPSSTSSCNAPPLAPNPTKLSSSWR
jgi:hypothetical protein